MKKPILYKQQNRTNNMSNTTFNVIKKIHGETFAKNIRDAGGLMHIEHLGEIVRYSNDDATAIIPHLRSLAIAVDSDESTKENIKSVSETLADAGYEFTHIKNKNQQEKFRKFYAQGQLPCSFSGSSWNWTVIFYAVKNGAAQLKPAKNPDREDDYSTSVLRIKCSDNAVSIVSRYNHGVNNPDSTFRCDLDAVAPGLRAAVENEFGISLRNRKPLLPENYHLSSSGQIFYSDCEQGGVYLGSNAWLESGVIKTAGVNQMLIHGCLLDADFTMTPVADGSDKQGLSEPWNDNKNSMKNNGYSFYRNGFEIFAKKGSEHILIARVTK